MVEALLGFQLLKLAQALLGCHPQVHQKPHVLERRGMRPMGRSIDWTFRPLLLNHFHKFLKEVEIPSAILQLVSLAVLCLVIAAALSQIQPQEGGVIQ